MKNLTFILVAFLLLTHNNQAFCQGHYGAYISSDNQYICPNNKPVNYFVVCGPDNSYKPTDTFSLFIEYGDGYDTTIYMQAMDMGMYFLSHSYKNTGIFMAKITALDKNNFKIEQSLEIIIGNSCTDISGLIYYELNNDCTFQGSDSIYKRKGVMVELSQNGNPVGSEYCDGNGKYLFAHVPSGYIYTLQPSLNDSLDLVTCHTDFCPVFRVENSLPDSFANFGLVASLNSYDLHGYVFTPGIRPAGGGGTISVDIFNSSCQHPVSGYAKIYSNPALTFDTSDQNVTLSGDTMILHFGNIPGSYLNKGFGAYIKVLSPATSKLGDSVHIYLEIYPTAGDANPLNNNADFISLFKNSFDPNEKNISTNGWSSGNEIKTSTLLNYMITFQNTGSAVAINVTLFDTLDNNLDLNTFHFNSSSFNYCSYTFLTGNIVEFMFPYINLPDSTSDKAGSYGNVSYSILPKSNLSPGDIIHNTASIVFDNNKPVLTNTVKTKIYEPLSVKPVYPDNNKIIDIYPVPFKDVFYVDIKNPQKNISLEIYDVSGKLVLKTNNLRNGINTIQSGQIQSGLFLLKFIDSDNNVIQHNIVVAE